jgi:hypothetical protein
MKKLFLVSVVLFIVSVSLSSQTRVNGYFKSNGTYVQPHVRSSRNSTNHDNWSTAGNTNPYTGNIGTVAKDYSNRASNYGSGQTIYTGPKGGQYYNNNSGTKTYVPKTSSYGSTYNYKTSTRRTRSSSYY